MCSRPGCPARSADRDVREAGLYWGFRLAEWLAARTPQRLGYWLAAAGGELYFWCNPGHSGKAVENFAVVLADTMTSPRVRATSRRAFRNYGKLLFDFFRQTALDSDALLRNVSAGGFEHLDAALARGRGALLILGHCGNWDLAGILAASLGYPIVALVDSFTPEGVDRRVRAARAKSGLQLLPVEHPGALRHVRVALGRNQVVVVIADRPQPIGGVPIQFFGRTAWFPVGTARFAIRYSAPVLTGYLLRRPGDVTAYGEVEPEIEWRRTGDTQGDIVALTQQIGGRLERRIREYPDQWFMFRRMWPPPPSTPARTQAGRLRAGAAVK